MPASSSSRRVGCGTGVASPSGRSAANAGCPSLPAPAVHSPIDTDASSTYQPQIRLDRHGRTADQRVEALPVRLEDAVIRQARIHGRQLRTEGPGLRRQQLILQRFLGIPQPQHGSPRDQERGSGARRTSIGIPSPVNHADDSWWFHQCDSPSGPGILIIWHTNHRKNSYFTGSSGNRVGE